ncbi:helix-turn-helix domain-containing protein [Fluoribacter dumoffii]|uniref:Antitoxin HigA n=1 Tax=Fluoribacter dumoffii TaxID=463 RepID=A0A377G803_9GAMM|nr:helix-turn-helix domain-containing protein [Fluoribacter dumoffii]KTC89359.1 Antitoxin HigA [Fluoribacter dumoffii NY 23]MCW8417609.1 helix-turn-helix domain-containing protein [Fluoribacter dumoffii]MCW8454549.1 helix-turn-helix domain-containing protein [Fluoribacter dumoffii]MCW8461375.1 helix-turn-helix domain-containing protein [Fluoribacter dumoffii]MCW8484816.1 helix-turn-helix domain-containing protein [Fluoribacter dumoffii]
MTALARNHLEETIQHWKHISPVIHDPQNEDEYEKLANMLDQLLDIVGDNESHELMGLVDVISYMISMYDEQHTDQLKKGTATEALQFLMDQHGLDQSDLKNEIGSQGVVSEILNGKRQLNISHIKKLAERFHVTPATFID